MHALVTGAAGFIGSTLSERLLAEGHRVTAVDCLTAHYDPAQKRSNLDALSGRPGCTIVEADLRTTDLAPLVGGVDVVFHLSGQPGVRSSWDSGFPSYVQHNILVTQRLLEAVRGLPLQRLVYASSSSVYGNAPAYPTSEGDLPRPQSPYGVTKLAAEQLCTLYARTWDVPTISLRYFTVYGPRQRSDMAIHRLIEAALSGERFPLYGDGRQVRDFTFVDDVVEANLLATTCPLPPGTVINVAGGSATTVSELVRLVGELTERPVELDRRPSQPGDVERTGGSTERANRLLGWEPRVGLPEGLAAQLAWHRDRRGAEGVASASGRPEAAHTPRG
jgi:nucleoside-diphosphate-sugar epimerase